MHAPCTCISYKLMTASVVCSCTHYGIYIYLSVELGPSALEIVPDVVKVFLEG